MSKELPYLAFVACLNLVTFLWASYHFSVNGLAPLLTAHGLLQVEEARRVVFWSAPLLALVVLNFHALLRSLRFARQWRDEG